ncbi:sperm-associated microtubule inner protein 4 [Limanda limanda]|uniref:sperm-associated microtubule inner protein 4 n=1 Tax=Limanda limanda TaxID=27771 RepID=UPI0029C95A33|nr:sperm-associated microtubule inner protein 4 [Limanda limanda]
MEPDSSLTYNVPSDLNRRYPCDYGGAIMSEYITSPELYTNTGKKKSKLRLNDQLIPKPTDINVAEKMSQIPTLREHPYSSHISRFAMFPSFQSPDDPVTGVRAASQPYPSRLIPNSAPDVTLQSKTFGGPYRHEILETPIKTKQKAVRWTGEHSFRDQSDASKGENQVFYPTPPKTVLPNPKLRHWDLSLSERTSNMLKNLERTHWITSYQMDYNESGPANPLKVDDFEEKTRLSGIISHTATLREGSYPVFVPSKPKHACRRRQGSHVGRSTCSPTAAELLNTSSARQQGAATAIINQLRPQEITAQHNEAPDLNPKGHSWSFGAQRDEPSQGASRRVSMSQNNQEADRSQQNFKVAGIESLTESLSRAPSELQKPAEGRELAHGISNLGILQRPRVLPGIRPGDSAGTTSGANALLDLQNSFSKTAAHRRFNNSITHAAVDLRDNVVTGRQHNFYGINCCYLHG